ncbi:MAG: 2'-5' RNA ligase family protein [Methanoregula sp.]
MEEIYLIEIRLATTKWRIRTLILAIADAFHLESFIERHPHITLFGPLVLHPGTTSDELLKSIEKVACDFLPVPFLLNGWEMRRGMHGSVIAFAVTPSKSLRDLTRELASVLDPVSESLNAWDSRPEAKWFHVTVANKLEQEQAAQCFLQITAPPAGNPECDSRQVCPACRVFAYLKKFLCRQDTDSFPPIILDGTGLRITVLQNENILAEYDLLGKCWVYGDHSHDSSSWQETLRQYRIRAGFELQSAPEPDNRDIFVIADLHLGHANIIRYCSRPFLFSDCGEMDTVLIRNWNLTVGEKARIYHIGDLQYGRDAPPVAGYLEQLKGKATFITGNHDTHLPGWLEDGEILHEGTRFFLVHDPDDAPPGFDGWVIHGHHHNNELGRFPFLDFVNRRVNVSAEVIGFVPVSIRELHDRIREQETSRSIKPVLLRFPYVEPEESQDSVPAQNPSRS